MIVATLPAPGEPIPAASFAPGETVAILYTSGTTGPSKGVCCPQAQYFWWAAHTAALLGLGDGEVLLTTLPLFHTNALNAFYQALLTGSTLVVERRFSVSDFLAGLVRHRATATYLLGAMVPMLLSRPPSDEERRHDVRVALAPGVPAEYHRRSPAGSASRSSTVTVRPKRISCWATRPANSARERWAACGPASMSPSSTPRTIRCLTAKRGNCWCGRSNPSRSPRAISRWPTRRWRRGATSGSIPATASCASRTDAFAFSTA